MVLKGHTEFLYYVGLRLLYYCVSLVYPLLSHCPFHFNVRNQL